MITALLIGTLIGCALCPFVPRFLEWLLGPID